MNATTPEPCHDCHGGGWMSVFEVCPTCKGSGAAPLAPLPTEEAAPERVAAPAPAVPAPRPAAPLARTHYTQPRKRGLLGLQVSLRERAAFAVAAERAGLGVTVWARAGLLRAASAAADPPNPKPAPTVAEVPGVGRARLRDPRDLRDKQMRIGLTVAERRRLDAAAEATGRRISRWSRAVLYALAGLD